MAANFSANQVGYCLNMKRNPLSDTPKFVCILCDYFEYVARKLGEFLFVTIFVYHILFRLF